MREAAIYYATLLSASGVIVASCVNSDFRHQLFYKLSNRFFHKPGRFSCL